jgi:hypothetical protein
LRPRMHAVAKEIALHSFLVGNDDVCPAVLLA